MIQKELHLLTSRTIEVPKQNFIMYLSNFINLRKFETSDRHHVANNQIAFTEKLVSKTNVFEKKPFLVFLDKQEFS